MSSRTEFVSVKVYGVVGADNVMHTAVVEDEGYEVYFEVLDDDGEYQYFEAEAYHVEQWCKDFDFQYYEGVLEGDVDLEEA